MAILSKVSLNNLRGVNPLLINLVEKAIVTTPIDFRVTEGLRSLATQRHYVEIGVSKTLDSRHLTGDAVDLVPWINGPRWEWPVIFTLAEHIRSVAIQLNVPIRWGGVWDLKMSFTYTTAPCKLLVENYIERQRKLGNKVFLDGPHFELCNNSYKSTRL